MKESLTSRIKIKKNKILRRKMAADHFRTRKSKKNISSKKKITKLDFSKKRILNYKNRDHND